MIRYRPLFDVDIAHDYFLSRGDVVLEAQPMPIARHLPICILSATFSRCFPTTPPRRCLPGTRCSSGPRRPGFSVAVQLDPSASRHPADGSAGRRSQTDVRSAAHRQQLCQLHRARSGDDGLLPVQQRLAEPDGGREFPFRPRAGIRGHATLCRRRGPRCRRRHRRSICLSRCGTPGPRRRRFPPTGGAFRRIHSTRPRPIGRGRSCCPAIRCSERSSTTPARISPMPLNGSPPACSAISMSRSPTPSCRSLAFSTSTSVIWRVSQATVRAFFAAGTVAATEQTFTAEQGTLGRVQVDLRGLTAGPYRVEIVGASAAVLRGFTCYLAPAAQAPRTGSASSTSEWEPATSRC